MIPLLNVIGLVASFLGGVLLFLDSLQMGDRLPRSGLKLGPDPPFQQPAWRFVARAGFGLMTLGFALQLPAACSAHDEQQPAASMNPSSMVPNSASDLSDRFQAS
jgi:hypothetical protein